MLTLPRSLLDRLMPLPWCGCWVWTGEWDSGNGYGKVSWEGQDWMAHRLIWTLLRGPIPSGLLLDHHCRVRRCCFDDHLEPVTTKINTHRGNAILFRPAHAYRT